MTHRTRQPEDRSHRHPHPVGFVLLVLVIGGLLVAGCGGSSSSSSSSSSSGTTSKPAYCAPVASVENAAKSLPTVDDVKKNGIGTLKTAVAQLQKDATAAVNQAKSEFSSQTTALKSSVDALTSTVKQVTGTPSVQTLAQLPGQLSAVSTAAKNLKTATSSKCG